MRLLSLAVSIRILLPNGKVCQSSKPPYQINAVPRFWYNSELEYKWYMAPGVLALLVHTHRVKPLEYKFS